ncbi:MAG: ribonuclease P protein component [Muribaculaceae bacterium]|nr:ribonuclease P protein component [Muribaculaceae bacterium]
MPSFRLYKKQRLCSPTAIETLFAPASGARASLCYPLRAVWRPDPGRRSDAPMAFVVMVPKRRLRHAVDRVCMRRRIREAFRLGHAACSLPEGTRLDVAFVYVANSPKPYAQVEHAMQRLLADISHDQNQAR